MTVHDLPQTYLLKLDSMANQYLKRWAGLPRCATTAILHLDSALNIKNISSLYLEAHTLSHTATRLKGDRKVNLALDNKLERESEFRRKKSVTVEAESIFKSAFSQNTVQGEVPGTTPETVITISDEGVTTLTLPDSMDDLSPPETFIKEVKADAK